VNAWSHVRFEDAEYAARLERLRAGMRADGLDALVLSDDRHTWYLTGFGDVGPIGSLARPRVLVVPLEGEPCFFVHRSTRTTVAEMSAVPDVRTYAELGHAPVDEIAALLGARGARRVGAELGGGLRLGITAADLAELQRAQPLLDCSGTVWRLRAVKSRAEIARLRRACALTSDAYAAVLPSLSAGLSELEIAGRLRAAMAERGADSSWVWVVTGRGQYDRVDGVLRDRRVETGELVYVDMGACVGGYWADFSRAAVIGTASPAQRALHALVGQVTTLGSEALLAGGTTGDVARLVDAAMAERGLEFSSQAGRYGHGMGMVTTEYPDVWRTSEVPIEAGMVLTMEPGMWTEEGMFHLEHDVLVGEHGNEILSTFPLDLVETG
jgi:Xaa-Pro aminopeptidase